MTSAPVQIQLALISHTNAGKTTLARTLTGVDLGEVRDAPHVTTLSESHPLLTTPSGDVLLLWDTPGFGDSVRLYQRLSMSGNPIGWFMREVVDRYRDRPFWLSQQAIRTARDEADVVLYLVNASEDPGDAGYLAPEMKILQWLGKPVVILLNQMGPPQPFAREQAEQKRWQDQLDVYPVVKRVIAMDAFARCWVHESVFYEAIGALIDAHRKEAYARLYQAWDQANQTRLHAAMELVAAQLVRAARDKEIIQNTDGPLMRGVMSAIGRGKQLGQRRQAKAMEALLARFADDTRLTTASLLKLYRLDAGAAARINERVLKAFVVRDAVDATQAGLLGAVISGAATGLAADLMSGGLTLGAGALLGAVVGAMTAAGAAWAFNETTDRREPSVQFSDDFLHQQLIAGLLRYLAVIHFGRGRGRFVEAESPAFWQQEVETAVRLHAGAISEAMRACRSGSSPDQSNPALVAALTRVASEVLKQLYPGGHV
jgi:hypothetical protein